MDPTLFHSKLIQTLFVQGRCYHAGHITHMDFIFATTAQLSQSLLTFLLHHFFTIHKLIHHEK